MIAVARVPDPKGKVRYLVAEITGFITMTMEGALLKISAEDPELTVPAGQPFDVHLKVARLAKLTEPVRMELRLPEELEGQLEAKPLIARREDEEGRAAHHAGGEPARHAHADDPGDGDAGRQVSGGLGDDRVGRVRRPGRAVTSRSRLPDGIFTHRRGGRPPGRPDALGRFLEVCPHEGRPNDNPLSGTCIGAV